MRGIIAAGGIAVLAFVVGLAIGITQFGPKPTPPVAAAAPDGAPAPVETAWNGGEVVRFGQYRIHAVQRVDGRDLLCLLTFFPSGSAVGAGTVIVPVPMCGP